MTTRTWTTRATLSSELSRRLVDAAVAAATAGGLRVTVVTVDESGVLREVLRMDGAPLVSLQTAMNKGTRPPPSVCRRTTSSL
ncbi:MAG: heme-binding protein [Trebonia sp.]